MAWTAPRTYVTGELMTAAMLNIHLRDNLLESAAAKVTTAGDLLYATGANALARLAASTIGHLLTAQGAGVAPIWAAPTVGTTVSATLTGDVSVNPVDAWENVLSVSLVAGTWLLLAQAHVDNVPNISPTEGWLRVYNETGTTVLVDAYLGAQPASGFGFKLSYALIGPPLVLGATSTIRLQARCTLNADLVVRATSPSAGGTTNKATHLVALRIA